MARVVHWSDRGGRRRTLIALVIPLRGVVLGVASLPAPMGGVAERLTLLPSRAAGAIARKAPVAPRGGAERT